MLANKARTFLDKLKLSGRPTEEKLEKPVEAKVADGHYTDVTFYTWAGAQFRFGSKTRPFTALPVAFLKPKPQTTTPSLIEYAVQAEKRMGEKKIPEDFNQFSLYYDVHGNQIATQAEHGDLFDFMKKNAETFSLDELRDFVGQIILAVYDHHRNGRAHRDIKPENFLVFFRNGKYQIKLADHRNSIDVEENGQASSPPPDIFGTHDFMSPELKKIYHRSRENLANEVKLSVGNLQRLLNFKANDCFALGNTIYEMGVLLPRALRKKNEFTRLPDALRRVKVDERITIEDALRYTFFGDSPQKRTAFFDKLRKRARASNLKIDGYDQLPLSVDDPFYFLDRSIKPLYRAGQRAMQIAEQIADCHQVINTDCKEGTFAEIVQRFDRLKQNSSYLLNTRATDAAYEADLTQLKEDAANETKSVLIRLLTEKSAVTALLKKAVDEAYSDYVIVNKLEDKKGEPTLHSFDLFAAHGQKGRGHAKALKQSVDLAFAEGRSPKEMFDLIHAHYHHVGNSYRLSFKTILQNKLQQLSDKSIDEWKLYFDGFANNTPGLVNSA